MFDKDCYPGLLLVKDLPLTYSLIALNRHFDEGVLVEKPRY
jgi:hypothetical protein